MSVANVCKVIAATIVAATAAAQLAHAELPYIEPVQVLEPSFRDDFVQDPNEFPYPTYMGSALAIQGNVALVGLPGAFEHVGHVAFFVRNAAGTWIRRQTLRASDAAVGANFGTDIAINNKRALIASDTAVYIFQLESGAWRERGKLAIGRPVQITDIDWHWNIAVVGVTGASGNAAYAFFAAPDGRFRRVARMAPPDAQSSDRFGERVSIYNTTVAVTAPGYNSDEGAAYVFSCNEVRCTERQKLLANDGAPGDDFGHGVDVHGDVLVIGAPRVDVVVGDGDFPPSEENFSAGGAAYVFVRSGGTWVEYQAFRPTPRELNSYSNFGYEIVVSPARVFVGAPYGVNPWDTPYVVEYAWSGGILAATRALTSFVPSHGQFMALSGRTLLAGTPETPGSFYGEVAVYNLSAR